MKKLRKILLLVLVAALLSVSVLAATGVVDAKLTYRDIKEITDELVRVITSMYHKRVAYPDKKSLLK